MTEHDPHVDEHEIAKKAEEILEAARLGYDDSFSDKADTRFAIEQAESILKFGRKDGVEAARAALRAAAANAVAPELRAERDEAKREAMTDDLTGLPNPKAFKAALTVAETDPNVAIISFDGDNFKQLNKGHNLDVGDAAIVALAQSVNEAAQAHGVKRVFRGGGDEFYVLAKPELADAIVADAQHNLAEKLGSGEDLIDGRGASHPSDLYQELGLSGAWGMNLDEADKKMNALKAAGKAAKKANAA